MGYAVSDLVKRLREFEAWIDPGHSVVGLIHEALVGEAADALEAIEKKYLRVNADFHALVSDCLLLKEERDRLQDKLQVADDNYRISCEIIADLEAEKLIISDKLAITVEALRWYGDPVTIDNGDRAREVLGRIAVAVVLPHGAGSK